MFVCACVNGKLLRFVSFSFLVLLANAHKHVNRITYNDSLNLSGRNIGGTEGKQDEKSGNLSVIFSSHFKLERLRILPLDQISFCCVWNTTLTTAHPHKHMWTLRHPTFTLLRFHYSIFHLGDALELNQKNSHIVIYNVYLRWNIIFSVKYIQLIYWRATLSHTSCKYSLTIRCEFDASARLGAGNNAHAQIQCDYRTG